MNEERVKPSDPRFKAVTLMTIAADLMGWNVLVDSAGEDLVRWMAIVAPGVKVTVEVAEAEEA